MCEHEFDPNKAKQLSQTRYNFEEIVNYCFDREISIEQYAEEQKERFLELFKRWSQK